jgi:hypothetical protein
MTEKTVVTLHKYMKVGTERGEKLHGQVQANRNFEFATARIGNGWQSMSLKKFRARKSPKHCGTLGGEICELRDDLKVLGVFPGVGRLVVECEAS